MSSSDEAYRLYSQYPKITSTGEERNVKATGDSGDVSRSSSYLISRAQAAYSQAQAHANSFGSTRSADEHTTANHTHESSSGDNENNWLEDVAKVAGRISAGAATTAVLTAWIPEVAGAADVVSLAAGLVALTADGILATEGKQTLATVIGDMAALVSGVGVVKEGKEIMDGLKDISHAVQHSAEYFSKKGYEWKTVSKVYGDLGGAIISAANTMPSSSSTKEGKDRS